MFEQTKALCQQFLNMGIPGFDLIVYKDGQCVLRHTGGYADRENRIPVQGNEKYHIYSCSKLFTCVAAMQLWEKGMFSLEDKLSDYMPAFQEMTVRTEAGIQKAKKPIRIQHLFQMTAGLNYDLQTPALQDYYEACNGRCPTVELVNQLAKSPLDFEPGEGWQYSLCHDVLAALAEMLIGLRPTEEDCLPVPERTNIPEMFIGAPGKISSPYFAHHKGGCYENHRRTPASVSQ